MKILLVLLFSFSSLASLLGYRHLHTGKSHEAMLYMQDKIKPLINKGRVNVYQLVDKKFILEKSPHFVQEQFFKIEMSDLIHRPDKNKVIVDTHIKKDLNILSKSKYRNYVESLVKIGSRSKGAEAKNYLVGELQKVGLNPISTDYNIVSFIKGTSKKSLVVIGHMDTVRNTVGADDNASGASGVLELARSLQEKLDGDMPKKSIYFVLSEDEEDGLLGAKYFIKNLGDKIKDIELVINMDMIAYNSTGVIDLETSKDHEKLAKEFADHAYSYSSLQPNIVLNPWGSDHVPFLNNKIPAILTIENWQDHTPCWHKSCDTLDTLNFEYAIEILKINFSIILSRLL